MKPCYSLILLTLMLPSLSKGASHVQVVGDLGKQFDFYCERQIGKANFSGSVLIVKEGKVVLQKGYGFANRQLQQPNSPDTLFEIASLAKQFTATAILALEEDGKLSTEDSIAVHLPNVPDAYRPVTIYHLMTHTGGLPRGGAGRGTDLSQAVRDYLAEPPQSNPGKKYRYSNGGYALLAGIVEQASGESFVDYCHKRLFKRANLLETGFCGEVFEDSELALGYTKDSQLGRQPNQDPYPPLNAFGYEYRGMGGVLSSTTDLSRWIIALDSGAVLSANAKRKLFQPCRSNNACGWEVFTFPEGQRCIGHGGSVRGFVCKLWMFPDDENWMIVLANQSEFDYQMLNELKWMLFDEAPRQVANATKKRLAKRAPKPAFIELPESDLAQLVGVYPCRDIEGLMLHLELEDGGLHVKLSCQATETDKKLQPAEAELARTILRGISQRDTSLLAETMASTIPKSWPKRIQTYLWPRHEKTWGKLEELNLLDTTSIKVGEQTWVHVWLELQHSKGTCPSFIAFRPNQKLQLLVLDANRHFGKSGNTFWPLSKVEFSPPSMYSKTRLAVMERGGLKLSSRLTALTFHTKKQDSGFEQ